jgi:signal transduction histidine kinase/ligand-binding sensor domain-containing protein
MWMPGLVLALLAARPAAALQPGAPPDQYTRTSWPSVAHSSAVNALLPQSTGAMWIGTAEALVRYDGRAMVTYDRQRHPGIVDGNIERVFEASDGALWIGSRNCGLSRLQGEQVTSLGRCTGEPGQLVRAFAETADGAIWVGSFGGVTRLPRGSMRPEPRSDGLPNLLVDALAVDDAGVLWAGTRGGLARWDPAAGRWQPDLGPLRAPVRVHALLPRTGGGLWVGSLGGGLWERSGSSWRAYGTADGLGSLEVTALLQERGGRLWVATRGGLSWGQGNGERFQPIELPLSTCGRSIESLAEDAEGGLWIGTHSCGLYRFHDRAFLTLTMRDGLPSDLTLGLQGNAAGTVWLGTRTAGMAAIDAPAAGVRPRARPLPCAAGLPCQGCWDIASGPGETFRVVCGTNDLLSWNGQAMQAGALPPGLSEAAMVAVASDGAVWLALEQKVVRWHQGVATSLVEQESLVGKRVMHEGSSGTMWIVAMDGAAAWRQGKLQLVRFPARDSDAEVATIHEDGKGALWLGTKGAGVRWVRHGRVTTIGVSHGLPTDWIVQILEDHRQRLWMSTSKGILWAPRRDFEEVAEGRRARLVPSVYDGADGVLMQREPFGHPAGWKGPDGRLWFATLGGVAVVNPAALHPPPPRLIIDELRVGGQSIAAPTGVVPVVGPGPLDLEARFSVASFAPPEAISFRHRLEGKDADWVEVGPSRIIRYTRLEPQRYRLSIQARHRDGDWGPAAAPIEFVLRPAFYRSWWFGLAAATAIALVLLGAHRLRLRRTRADLQAVLVERSRIARDIHDTLAQAFVATSVQLECLDKAVENDDRATIRVHLQTARRMVKESLEEARRAVWVLRPRSLEHGLPAALQTLAGGSSGDTLVELELAGTPRPLAPAVEANLLRIAQEAVANAYRHAGARRIILRLSYTEPRAVSLAVLDDGKGLAGPGREAPPIERGLAGMRERAADIGAQLAIESRAGGGTSIRVELPA